MNESPSNANGQDPLGEKNDPLWKLLGESPRPEPDAWFAVRTVARCRYAGQGAESWWLSLSGMWRKVLGGGLGISLAMGLLFMQIHTGSVGTVNQATADKQNVQEAFEIMASIDSTDTDTVPAPSTSSSWQDYSM